MMARRMSVLASCFFIAKLTFAGVMLGPGETLTYTFTSLPEVVSISPDLPAYDDYTFELHFAGDLYNNPPDDIRIRLFEGLSDVIPVHTIFGESVPNLSVTSSRVRIYRVPGTLWFDRTGKIEVEALAGSVNLDHFLIDLGPGQISYSSYIEVVPEPGSLALTLIGATGLMYYRRIRNGKRQINVAAALKQIEDNDYPDRF